MSTQRKGESREDYLGRRRAYRFGHRPELLAKLHEYRIAHRKEFKVYRTSKREEILAKHRAYNACHRQELYLYRMNPDIREREKANSAVAHAIRNGVLTPPESCQRCGDMPPPTFTGARSIEGHHHHGYIPKYWLDVLWLCPDCHAEVHRGKFLEVVQ